MKPFDQQTYYELLEVSPGASSQEIRDAWERSATRYAEGAPALESFADPEDAARLRARLLEAMEILTDEDLRGEYDRMIGLPLPPPGKKRVGPSEASVLAQESAIATAESALAQVSARVAQRPARESRPAPPEIPADAEFDGALLRRVRESRGLTVTQVAERTRISARHIENVEKDAHGELPPAVYLRGILMNLARELALDPLRVSKSYLQRIEASSTSSKGR